MAKRQVAGTRSEEEANSVKNLGTLYSAVVAISLSAAVYSVFDLEKTGFPIRHELLVFLAAYLVILVPFYHGAVNHLEQAHGGRASASRRRKGALLLDFGFLFLESCLFVSLAIGIGHPIFFAWSVIVLLVLDTVWAIIVHTGGFSADPKKSPEATWALINIFAAILLAFFLVYADLQRLSTMEFGVILFLFSLVRTIVDYWTTWDFYFGHER